MYKHTCTCTMYVCMFTCTCHVYFVYVHVHIHLHVHVCLYNLSCFLPASLSLSLSLSLTLLHNMQAGELWDLYRGFETAMLTSLQVTFHLCNPPFLRDEARIQCIYTCIYLTWHTSKVCDVVFLFPANATEFTREWGPENSSVSPDVYMYIQYVKLLCQDILTLVNRTRLAVLNAVCVLAL